MKVPYFDLKRQYKKIKPQLENGIIKTLRSTQYSLGEEVEIFEKNFSTFLNAEEEEIYLKSISDQIQVITKDLKTLEKAFYKTSEIQTKKISSDGLNEDVLTRHLLKLNEKY